MQRIIGMLAIIVLMAGCAGKSAPCVGSEPLKGVGQLVAVVSDDWNAPRGVLTLYERASAKESWKAAAGPVEVELGRSGLGWGRGLIPLTGFEGPVKREGDGRAPAGLFAITPLFAYPEAGLKAVMPVTTVTPTLVCVDDDKHPRYNTIFDAAKIKKDWTSDEVMLRPDGLYKVGAVVRHNMDDIQPGGGSCIFLHIRRAEGKPTAGCTAMTEEALRDLLGRLRPEAKPTLVQLPSAEYARLKSAWNLP